MLILEGLVEFSERLPVDLSGGQNSVLQFQGLYCLVPIILKYSELKF